MTGWVCVKKREKWRVLCNVNAGLVGGVRRPPLGTPGSAQGQIAWCFHLCPASVSGLNQVSWALLFGPDPRTRVSASCPHHSSARKDPSFGYIKNQDLSPRIVDSVGGREEQFDLVRNRVRLACGLGPVSAHSMLLNQSMDQAPHPKPRKMPSCGAE